LIKTQNNWILEKRTGGKEEEGEGETVERCEKESSLMRWN
jgi:hypothetical protein